MAIKKENIDFLFDTMKYYDNQYDKITENCFSEIYRALTEICEDCFSSNDITVLPVGSYAVRSNYQVVEPIEFYCILPANREILQKEYQQKKPQKTKKNKTIKEIYAGIWGKDEKNPSALDVAKKIMNEMQKYLAEGDKVYFKNNVVFLKIYMQDEDNTVISVNIHVVYDFDNDSGVLEFSKLGYKFVENTKLTMQNIFQKNVQTNGNYLLLCRLLKMLELELVLNNQSNYYLSRKTLFIETILYNIPNKFFEGEDFCEMFKNVKNYLQHINIENIYLPDDRKMPMFKTKGYYANRDFKSFVKKLSYLYENTDKLIDDALSKNQNNADENIKNDITMQTKNLNQNTIDNQKPKKRNKINKDIK